MFLWVDIETTGLDPANDLVLEIGGMVSNGFEVLETFNYIIYQDKQAIDKVANDKAMAMHTASGLLDEVARSPISIEDADRALYSSLKDYGRLIPAGSSLGQFDLQFIRRDMPNLDSILHYRSLDVSSLAIAAEIAGTPMFKKEYKHRAYDDAVESFNECKYLVDAMGLTWP